MAWRHNMLVLLTGVGIIAAGVLVLWATWPQAKDCPPEWQCRGSPQTNNPNCSCWDSK